MFSKILNPSKLDDLIQKSNADSLALTTILRKISNSPILLKATADSIKGKKEILPSMQQLSVDDAVNLLPEKAHIADLTLSGA
jgi:DNA repair and recombination protein RAD54B